jgi:SAM-dependent MidA family methyltransferase
MISGNQILIGKIIQKIKSEGPIPFKVFMEMVLYDPEAGYYPSSREKIGPGGDFYTSPEVHPSFGRLIANQLAEMAELILKDHDHFDWVEAGPGTGNLALHILKRLQEACSEVYTRMTYYMVEPSSGLIQRQKELFKAFPALSQKIRWVTSLEELPSLQGAIFSNELLDSFPVHRVTWKRGLQEIFVAYDGDQFIEILKPPSDPEIENYFKMSPVSWIEGQEGEVNLNAVLWIREAGRKLKKGFVITIDYGDLYEELYSVKRKKGTFLCYRNHKTNDNPYEWIGEQDMTSHVNFSALQKFGVEEDLSPLGYLEQSHFLIGLGMIEEIDQYFQTVKDASRDPTFQAMKHLIHPEGLGPIFKVLIQQKGMGQVRLKGLKFARKAFQK